MNLLLRRWILPVLSLTVVWVALWEDLTAANVLSGVVAALAVLVLARPPYLAATGRLAPVAIVRFLVYFTWKLLEASAIVAWEVVTPRNKIHQGIVAVPLETTSAIVATIVANAVSLTPGTVTIEVSTERRVLYVHVMHLHDIERVRADVRELERLVIAAFGSAPHAAVEARP